MPRENLLRHIFKHGPLSKHKDSSPREPVNNPQAAPSATSPVETTRANAEATSRLAKASAPVALQILPKIKEEPAREFGSLAGSLSSCSSSNTGAESATAVLAAQNTDNIPDPSTITTRDLVYAAIDEATSATHAHLDTLETTLALLETIRGLSETVEVLRREMKEKRKACQVAVKELAGFEEGVEKMHFANDGVVRGAR